ncbi:S-adenosyl-l-methionine hydroxide adenosyltransferase [Halorubrum sp. JWXQ-INN 858]|uniref:SAM hydrolase/SAM-dependent halogenase family protein n=1 Tax=Halorubrum sp. JWXQ-INN 858 TaxID=2690782 RepID=UPI00135BD4B2|nr:SAM-dependent chlorinase/fluorinase [Halorubrum sp. JWXQ-INN 858]MWV63347.1 S-adenosyl-l-methionine hydroxide adenosyltransferase [Halorubrum sp. JWXQ-INN 858]
MITLATDFGSPYPAAMKGVVRRRTDAEIVDVAHDLPRGDPRAAAFWLRFVLPEFPPAVHCAVVDPGVGTDRAAIAVRAGGHVLVAPDNGLALPPARALAAAVDAGIDVFRIDPGDPASATFHGRDVFAPAAAAIRDTRGTAGDDGWAADPPTAAELAALPSLTPTDSYVDRRLPEPDVADGEPDVVTGEVLVVDGFGNAITNVPEAYLHGRDRVLVNGEPIPVGATFASVPAGDRLVTAGSHGYVECDVNDGRGDDAFGLEPGDPVRFEG